MAEFGMNNHTDGDGDAHLPPEARIKLDWYQTAADIIINILADNVRREDVDVEFRPEKIRVKFLLPTGETYDRTFNLSKNINRQSCGMKVMQSKIEFRLRKFDGSTWDTLEVGPAQPVGDFITN